MNEKGGRVCMTKVVCSGWYSVGEWVGRQETRVQWVGVFQCNHKFDTCNEARQGVVPEHTQTDFLTRPQVVPPRRCRLPPYHWMP